MLRINVSMKRVLCLEKNSNDNKYLKIKKNDSLVLPVSNDLYIITYSFVLNCRGGGGVFFIL